MDYYTLKITQSLTMKHLSFRLADISSPKWKELRNTYTTNSPFTTRQSQFIDQLGATKEFSLRSKRFADFSEELQLPQGTRFSIDSFVKTYSNDVDDIIELIK